MDLDLRRANHADGDAYTRDGTRIAFTLHGDDGGTDRRVVLVHSLAMDRYFWLPLVDHLDASILVYDCRGHGLSDKPAGPYTVELFADDLADLLDHVGWESALVAGASMGGCIALAFAVRYPMRASALGLVDTTAWYGADAPKLWAERAEKAAQEGLGSLVGFQTTRWFSDKFRADQPDVVKDCVDVFMRNDVPAYAATCAMLGGADQRAALPRLTMPTAVIVGEEDYATPVAMAEALHRGIPGSTLNVLRGGRHLTPIEQPQAIAAEFDRLLSARR
ncbi:MAG: 3-oxoadipate enol-lactonase [Alphaproteobacteria bacterium]|nr:3-oxoadipate enol-lactonase [Alphaproteobacteria bacterium]